MKLTLGSIADIIHAEGEFKSGLEAVGYSIDSRTIGAGELFFAVKGDRFNGHDYVESALANGAIGAVVSQHWLPPALLDPCTLLRVPDDCDDCVLQSMQALAAAVRRLWGGRVIGITGSAGKTTTKEAVAIVLGAKYNVFKSAGNLNNGYGVPLQLLKLEPEREIAVIEMGMNHAGEIAELAKMAQPDWAVVSNVAPVHLEFFPDGLSGIARAKYELVQSLPSNGMAFLNADDQYVASFARGMGSRAIFYGLARSARVRAARVIDAGADGVRFTVQCGDQSADVALRMLGRHNVSNALAAIAVGVQSGISLTESAAAIGHLSPGSKRGEILHWRGATIINDAYNSNPKALDSMVDALLALPAMRHVVVAGEMLELGPDSAQLHADCGDRMAERGVQLVVGVRGHARELAAGAASQAHETVFLSSAEEAGAWLQTNLREGDAVLVKGSRGVGLERALAALT